MEIGFVGLGLMGAPMAANLVRAGFAVTAYNRSAGPREALRALGAETVETPAALFAAREIAILMLADDAVVDAVLGRGGPDFAARVGGHLIVNMGTHAPSYSRALEADVLAAGGAFVEAPVSGSRGPAESGQLVAMLAGTADAVARARPLMTPLCREVVEVGAVPGAMAMKLAVNLYLIATVAALAEAANLAGALALDPELFSKTILSGALRSDVAAAKLDKMVRGDFAPQAAISDVCKNAALVAAAAAEADAHAPLLGESRRLFEAVRINGGGGEDMAAVLGAFAKGGSY
jgi:3-hydroxyisobutyrate dehydrogenase